VKVFLIQLLSIAFAVLITGSIQSVTADHLEPGKGIFKDVQTLHELEATEDSNYQIYLQTVLRNGDGQLISVIERMHGWVVTHQITDHIFDTLMGKKEIIIIDNIKYEKVQYTSSPTLVQRTVDIYPIFEEIPLEQFTIYDMDEDTLAQMKKDIRDHYRWKIHYCATFEGHPYTCIPIFQAFTTVRNVTPTDVVTNQWTILRVLN
jgi:hypothetical protein